VKAKFLICFSFCCIYSAAISNSFKVFIECFRLRTPLVSFLLRSVAKVQKTGCIIEVPIGNRPVVPS
jgi:hypothetical protein